MVWFCVAMLPTVGPKVVGISFLGQHALSMIETCIKHRSLFLAVRLWYPLTLWKSCIVGSSGVFPWFLFRILEIIVMRFCWWNLPRAGNLYISALKTKSDPFNAHICMCIYIYPIYPSISWHIPMNSLINIPILPANLVAENHPYPFPRRDNSARLSLGPWMKLILAQVFTGIYSNACSLRGF